MLVDLRIRDFAIIDELRLRFDSGFSVLTGETGAGKSIIIDAVELVLGGRADTAMVRTGAEEALIEAAFRLSSSQQARLRPLLKTEGLEGDSEDILIVAREVRVNGRNICRVNGRSVTLSILREATEGLVDVHGQSEHLSILRPKAQLELVDRFADLGALRRQFAALAGRFQALQKELENLVTREQELAHRADLLRFQIDEIEAAGLEPGEEDALQEERVRLANAERLAELAGEATAALEEGTEMAPPALDLLGVAVRSVVELARIDPSAEAQREMLESATYQAEEVARSLRTYVEEVEYNPRRLRRVEARLVSISQLERKYGETVDDVLAYAASAAEELDGITHSEERVVDLQAEREDLLVEIGRLGWALSLRRRQAAQRLAQGIECELRDLRMEGARFGVSFQLTPNATGAHLSELPPARVSAVSTSGSQEAAPWPEGHAARVAFDGSGLDDIEFLVSTNPGEPLKPMARVASGGETARLMLALKTVLSRADATPTLVFDEIDQGIGGRVGATVGEKLWGLTAGRGTGASRHQVLCVTHLPQLAGFGDAHFRVEKGVADQRTVARVRNLSRDERVPELALMRGGTGDAAYQSANEILAQTERTRARLAERRGPEDSDRA